MTRRLAMLLLLSAALLVAACSTGGAPSGSATSAGGFLSVGNAWVREARAGGTTAAYLGLVNGRLEDDVLVGVSTDVAERATIHETVTKDGMMGMQQVDGVTIPAGKTVLLEPGGYHIMLENLVKDVPAGSQVTLVLTFEQTGPVSVTAEVRAS